MSSPDKPLRLLLIDEFPENTVLLDEALTVAGHDVMAWLPSSSDLREEVVRVHLCHHRGCGFIQFKF